MASPPERLTIERLRQMPQKSAKFLKAIEFFKIMEIKVIEDKKERFVFELVGGDHALCTVLKEELNQDSNVKTATYRVDHPLFSNPRILVDTSDSVTPRQAITNAAKRVQKMGEKIAKDLEKAL